METRSSARRYRPNSPTMPSTGASVCSKQLYDYSNELMELVLAEEEIPEPLVHKVIRQATVHLQIQPVLCGSALDGMGVQPILDAVAAYLPSPLDMPPVEGSNPRKKGRPRSSRKPDPAEPFCGLVFKVLPDKTGDLAWVRIYSGNARAELASPKPRQGQEGKRRPALADPRSTEGRAAQRGSGRRHRRRDRPPRLDHRRHALRYPRADPAGVDRVPRDGDLEGDRAGEHRRSQEARRDAGSCSASRTRPFGLRKTKRPARRLSAAWASCTWK